MKTTGRTAALAFLALVYFASCSDEKNSPSGVSFAARAARRAQDGAPPVIPHRSMGVNCVQCHSHEGRLLEGVGVAPPHPHRKTPGLSESSRCKQCHLYRATDAVWRDNRFEGVPQVYHAGKRQHDFAPPVIPHRVFMREDCMACHGRQFIRDELKTSHPHRDRCRQCHLESTVKGTFNR